MKLPISLVNLTDGDNILVFEILMKTPDQQDEQTIINSLKDGKQSIQRITQSTTFGDRLYANFSKEDQMITIYLNKVDFADDGMEFRSLLHYTSKLDIVNPPPSVTTRVSVIGRTISNINPIPHRLFYGRWFHRG